MMDYEIFKEVVKESILAYMPDEYEGMEARIDTVEKVNRKLDGLSLFPKNQKTKGFPTVSVNDMYEEYKMTGDLQAVLRETAEKMHKVFCKAASLSLDIGNVKENIIFQLVNTVQNEDMLKNMPHREFQDLSVIYRWVADMDENGIASSMINNNLAKSLGMGEEQLFEAAAENTKRILPPVVKSMDQVIRETFLADGMPPEAADDMMDEIPSEKGMWIISNQRWTNGAASMLYEDELHKLSVRLGTDLFILPSSIHEVIAVPADEYEPKELAQMVSEVNMGQVELGDRLSNQVYYYDKELRELTLATDTPSKRLDGIVAEQGHVYETKQSR